MAFALHAPVILRVSTNLMKPIRNAFTIGAHALCWLVLLCLPAVPVVRYGTGGALIARESVGLLLIGVLYFNYYFAVEQLYVPRKYGQLFTSVVISTGLIAALSYYLSPGDGMVAAYNLLLLAAIYAAAFGLRLYQKSVAMREEMLNAQITFLKSQINPHFLFNTLNSIYALALTQPDETPDAIIKLSAMMRYAIDEATQQRVPISNETGYINNYVALQKLRLTDNVKITYQLTEGRNSELIAPFLMAPFIENAFVHGVNPEENSDIAIKIIIEEDKVDFNVTNNKVNLLQGRNMSSMPGINATRKRLELLYPGRHNLTITDTNDHYKVSLQIHMK